MRKVTPSRTWLVAVVCYRFVFRASARSRGGGTASSAIICRIVVCFWRDYVVPRSGDDRFFRLNCLVMLVSDSSFQRFDSGAGLRGSLCKTPSGLLERFGLLRRNAGCFRSDPSYLDWHKR